MLNAREQDVSVPGRYYPTPPHLTPPQTQHDGCKKAAQVPGCFSARLLEQQVLDAGSEWF